MLTSLFISIGAIILMLFLWIGVQNAWRRMFADYIADEDVLAERRSCSNCGCTTVCRRKTKPLSTK